MSTDVDTTGPGSQALAGRDGGQDPTREAWEVGSPGSASYWVPDVALELWVAEEGDGVTVTLSGRFVAKTAEPVRRLLDHLVEEGYLRIRLDLTQVTEADRLAQAVLAEAGRRLRRRGGDLVAVATAGAVAG